MKLILCTKCQDVFKLGTDIRFCECEACEGYYKKDGLHAVYSGKYAIPIGFCNVSLIQAIKYQPECGQGELFTAFVIPKKCNTFVKI